MIFSTVRSDQFDLPVGIMAEQLATTVATISRFHSFEVALQLQKRGALKRIYSGLARRFLRRYPVEATALHTFP